MEEGARTSHQSWMAMGEGVGKRACGGLFGQGVASMPEVDGGDVDVGVGEV